MPKKIERLWGKWAPGTVWYIDFTILCGAFYNKWKTSSSWETSVYIMGQNLDFSDDCHNDCFCFGLSVTMKNTLRTGMLRGEMYHGHCNTKIMFK